jgi:hypothetical protein
MGKDFRFKKELGIKTALANSFSVSIRQALTQRDQKRMDQKSRACYNYCIIKAAQEMEVSNCKKQSTTTVIAETS